MAKVFRRHFLPLIITPVLLTCGWLVVTAPITFVFIIDDAMETSEVVSFILYVICVGLAISVFVAAPTTWIIEKFFREAKIIIALIAGAMLLTSVFIILGYVFDSQLMLTSYSWSGTLLVFLFTMATYLLIFELSNFQKPQLNI